MPSKMTMRLKIGVFLSACAAIFVTSTAVATGAPTGTSGILIDQRPCSDAWPKTITLVLPPDTRHCYGGTIGHNYLSQVYVKTVIAGDYTGYLTCNTLNVGISKLVRFYPGEIRSVERTCTRINITAA